MTDKLWTGKLWTGKLWTCRNSMMAAGAVGIALLGIATLDSRQALATPVANYEKTILAKKPVAFWRLGESIDGLVVDRSGNKHHGLTQGRVTVQQSGAIAGDLNKAVKLDGKGPYIEIPSHPHFSQPTSQKGLTVEVWVRPDKLKFAGETAAADPYIMWLGKGETGKQEWGLRFYSDDAKNRPNRISAYMFNPAGGLGAGAYFQDQLQPGVWMHIVACFDPGDANTANAGVRIYKNGVLRSEPQPGMLYNNPQWQIKPVAGNAPLRLGTINRKSFLAGAIDEVAIYPRVLSAKEILENYNVGKGKL
jgi:hypothetical protein